MKQERLPLPLGKCGKRDAFAIGEGRVEPARPEQQRDNRGSGFRSKRIGAVDPHSDLSRLAGRSRNGTDRISVSSFHARARLLTPKNRGPDQCVPVIRSAITVSDRYRWPSYSNPSPRTRTVWV